MALVEYPYPNFTRFSDFVRYPVDIAGLSWFWTMGLISLFMIYFMSGEKTIKSAIYACGGCTFISFFMVLLDLIPYTQFQITFVLTILISVFGLLTQYEREGN